MNSEFKIEDVLDENCTVFERTKVAGLSVEHSIPSTKRFEFDTVLMHGMCCTGATWLPFMKSLSADGHECIAPTHRGHGDSKAVADLGKVSIEDFIQDGCDFLKKHNRKVVLVGHSMGELIAANVAERCPEYVLGHVGLTSAPPAGMFMGPKTAMHMIKHLPKMWNGEQIKFTWDDAAALLFNHIPKEYHQELYASLCYESGTAAWEITLHKFGIRRLRCPSLHIGGKYDQITPFQKGVAKRLGADFQEVPCGHMVMFDPNVDSALYTIRSWIGRQLERGFAPI